MAEEEWEVKEKNVRAWSVVVNYASLCAGEVSDNCLPPVLCFF